jgi:hypothetical protein
VRPDITLSPDLPLAKPSVDHTPIDGFVLVREGAIVTMSEWRTKKRTTINHGALAFFKGRAGVYSCCVCDVTNDGARIWLSGVDIMPPAFDISFDNFRTTRRCRLIWRAGDNVGVAFES